MTDTTLVVETVADRTIIIGQEAGTPGPAGPSVEVLDEGVSITSHLNSIDFAGTGVHATAVGDDVTVTISGGGGGGASDAADLTYTPADSADWTYLVGHQPTDGADAYDSLASFSHGLGLESANKAANLQLLSPVTSSTSSGTDVILPVDSTSGVISITLSEDVTDHVVAVLKIAGGSNVVLTPQNTGGTHHFNSTTGPTTLTLSSIGEVVVLKWDHIQSLWVILSHSVLDPVETADITAAVAAEASLRTTADNTLQSNITAEASTRSTADTTLQTNITNEASSRATGDTTNATNLTTHINNGTGAHAATAVSNTPAGNIASTTVQAALNELDSEKATTGSVTALDAATEKIANKRIASGYQDLDSSGAIRLPAAVVSGGTLTGASIRSAQSIQLSANYTQSVPPTDEALHPGVRVNWHATLSDNGGSLGPQYSALGADGLGPVGIFDTNGLVKFGANMSTASFTPISYANILKNSNDPGSTRTMTPAWHFMEAGQLFADGATVTLRNNDVNHGGAAFVSSQFWGTKNTGTLTGVTNTCGLTSFLSVDYVLGNSHVATRIGYDFFDLNNYLGTSNAALLESVLGYDAVGGGTVDKQVAVRVPFLSGGTTNYGLENGSATTEIPKAVTVAAAATTIPCTATVMALNNTSGAAVTITNTPAITAGVDGQRITLTNITSTAGRTITLTSGGSSGMVLGAPTRVIGIGGSITLSYSTTAAAWLEVAHSAGSTGTLALPNTVTISDGTAADGSVSIQSGATNASVTVRSTSTDVQGVVALRGLTSSVNWGPGGGTGTDCAIARSGSAALTVTGSIAMSAAFSNSALMTFSAASAGDATVISLPIATNGNATISSVVSATTHFQMQFGDILGASSLVFRDAQNSLNVLSLIGGATGSVTLGDPANLVFGTSTGTKIGTATTQKLSFYNATPIVRPGAYTQTFSTADKTHAARTSANFTDSTGGTPGTTLAAVTGTTYSSDIPTIRNWIASLADQITKTRADLADSAQALNSVIDDLQALGLVG